MSIFFDSQIDSKYQIMMSQLVTSLQNVDWKLLNSNFLHVLRKSTARGVKSWKLFVHISKVKGDMTFWILEKFQSTKPPSIFIFKLKLCCPVSNLTYMLHIDCPIWVEPALLSTSKRICDIVRSDVINYLINKNLFNMPELKNLKWYDF